jgi:hypothetical protein
MSSNQVWVPTNVPVSIEGKQDDTSVCGVQIVNHPTTSFNFLHCEPTDATGAFSNCGFAQAKDGVTGAQLIQCDRSAANIVTAVRQNTDANGQTVLTPNVSAVTTYSPQPPSDADFFPFAPPIGPAASPFSGGSARFVPTVMLDPSLSHPTLLDPEHSISRGSMDRLNRAMFPMTRTGGVGPMVATPSEFAAMAQRAQFGIPSTGTGVIAPLANNPTFSSTGTGVSSGVTTPFPPQDADSNLVSLDAPGQSSFGSPLSGYQPIPSAQFEALNPQLVAQNQNGQVNFLRFNGEVKARDDFTPEDGFPFSSRYFPPDKLNTEESALHRGLQRAFETLSAQFPNVSSEWIMPSIDTIDTIQVKLITLIFRLEENMYVNRDNLTVQKFWSRRTILGPLRQFVGLQERFDDVKNSTLSITSTTSSLLQPELVYYITTARPGAAEETSFWRPPAWDRFWSLNFLTSTKGAYLQLITTAWSTLAFGVAQLPQFPSIPSLLAQPLDKVKSFASPSIPTSSTDTIPGIEARILSMLARLQMNHAYGFSIRGSSPETLTVGKGENAALLTYLFGTRTSTNIFFFESGYLLAHSSYSNTFYNGPLSQAAISEKLTQAIRANPPTNSHGLAGFVPVPALPSGFQTINQSTTTPALSVAQQQALSAVTVNPAVVQAATVPRGRFPLTSFGGDASGDGRTGGATTGRFYKGFLLPPNLVSSALRRGGGGVHDRRSAADTKTKTHTAASASSSLATVPKLPTWNPFASMRSKHATHTLKSTSSYGGRATSAATSTREQSISTSASSSGGRRRRSHRSSRRRRHHRK